MISPDREATHSVIEDKAATINVIAFQNRMARTTHADLYLPDFVD